MGNNSNISHVKFARNRLNKNLILYLYVVRNTF